MGSLLFSVLAEADLLEVAVYSKRMWGAAQAEEYLGEIEACCERLAEIPLSGRACDKIRPGLRRTEQGKHVIFYRLKGEGILIVRVLHERMLPDLRRLLEDSTSA